MRLDAASYRGVKTIIIVQPDAGGSMSEQTNKTHQFPEGHKVAVAHGTSRWDIPELKCIMHVTYSPTCSSR